MRICIFTSVFLPDVGGAELAVDALARGYQNLGHDVVVLAQGNPAKLDVPYDVAWVPKPVLPRWYPGRIGKRLIGLHNDRHIDVVHANYTMPVGYAAVKASETAGFPVVIGSQGGDLYHSSKHRKRQHMWSRTEYAVNHAHGLVAISPHMRALMEEINPSPKCVADIPNGVHVKEFSEPAERPSDYTDERPYCLCLGNLGPMKGFDHAIQAFAKVQDRMGDTIMLVVGDGSMREELEALATKHGLMGDRVQFLGQRTGEAKRWLMRHSRFGVMPSIEEGLPLVGAEFLASGKPLLGSTNPSFDELVDESNGCRVTPKHPQELGELLVKMHESDLDSMGEASLRRAERFDWSRIAEEYVQFFERVIAEQAK